MSERWARLTLLNGAIRMEVWRTCVLERAKYNLLPRRWTITVVEIINRAMAVTRMSHGSSESPVLPLAHHHSFPDHGVIWRFIRYLLFWCLHLEIPSFFQMPMICPPSASIRGDLLRNSWRSYLRLSQKERPKAKGSQYRSRATLHTFIIVEVQNNLLVGPFLSPYFIMLNHFLAVTITDEEYPVRPAFSLLNKVLEDFTTKVPQSSFSNPTSISFPIVPYINDYQDPKKVDALLKVQDEIEEIKIVLVRLRFRLIGHYLKVTLAQNNWIGLSPWREAW